MDREPWLIRIDTGGTFTDGWARSPDGRQYRCKILSHGVLRARVEEVLSTHVLRLTSTLGAETDVLMGFRIGEHPVAGWDAASRLLTVAGPHGCEVGESVELTSGEEAPVVAGRLLTGTRMGRAFPEMEVRIATTRATNALLERKGEAGILLITAGFEDLLTIRDQRRPDLFALTQKLPEPLFEKVVGVRGRLAADGNEVTPLDLAALRRQLAPYRQAGETVAAVALMNSHVNPVHERAVGDLLREMGFTWASLSHELSSSMRILPRAETVVANAYLAPIMERFVARLREGFEGARLSFMTSAGHLSAPADYRPVDSLLSGPAGGVVGAVAAGREAGRERLLTFDMGGTSTDVARLEASIPFRYEQVVGGMRVMAPAARIETVAAGGGSICRWELGGLSVGPESAGADPGPACYGKGGPLTVTDVNLLLGFMEATTSGIPIFVEHARARFEELKSVMAGDGAAVPPDGELLAGLREIAVEKMADAIRTVSLRDGANPAEYALVAFGGAGPQHACAVADKLGVREILVPGEAGILSAWGLHQAVRECIATRQLWQTEKAVAAGWEGLLKDLIAEALADLGPEGSLARVLVELRLWGQDSVIEIESPTVPSLAAVTAGFAARYEVLYGYPVPPGREVELVTVRVVAGEAREEGVHEGFGEAGKAGGTRILQDHLRTCVVESGWTVAAGEAGSLRLQRAGEQAGGTRASGVVEEELYRCRFERVVHDMGELLRRTALSTNVKERLDYSCALLDAQGRLVVNAPHIPVHLGALGLCVREVSRAREWRDGDMVVVNHPGYGGSHLPDVTVISPVFHEGVLLAYVANRAHHAEIGGLTPGSMPAAARALVEEGVVLPPTLLFEQGRACFSEIAGMFRRAPYPSRALDDNLADLAAQAAANRHGVAAVQRLVAEGGSGVVGAHMEALYGRAAAVLKDRLSSLHAKSWEGHDAMDDGTPVKVVIRNTGAGLTVSFAGSGATHPGNLNATPAVVRSAVLYVLRLWVEVDLPLNEGLLDAVTISVPPGFLNPSFPDDPADCPAVVGGNVETSQRLVDVMLHALGLLANGQGTMNNLLFGNEHFGYYETIGGGAGAGPKGNGISGCHVHMSNTAITDPEILEHRFPLRLHRFALRQGSAGAGKWRGGEGLVREIEFLEAMTVSLLTQRRGCAPQGGQGGGSGRPGSQGLLFPNGDRKALEAIASFPVSPGTRLHLETPGGGGWGRRRVDLTRDVVAGKREGFAGDPIVRAEVV